MISATVTLDCPGLANDEKYEFSGLTKTEGDTLKRNFLDVLNGLADAAAKAGVGGSGEKTHDVVTLTGRYFVNGDVKTVVTLEEHKLPDSGLKEIKRLLSADSLVKGRCR